MKDRWTIKRTTTVGPLLIVTVPCPGGVWMRIRGGVSGAYYGPWRLARVAPLEQVGWAMPDDLTCRLPFLRLFPVLTERTELHSEPLYRLATPEETAG